MALNYFDQFILMVLKTHFFLLFFSMNKTTVYLEHFIQGLTIKFIVFFSCSP